MKESAGKVTRDERRDWVARLYPQCGTRELARRFDVSDVTIRNDLRAIGIPIVRSGLTPGQRRHAVRMRRQGRSLRDIAETLGCNYGTLRRYLSERGESGRPSNRDFGPSGAIGHTRLTLSRAARRFGIAPRTLRDAFERGAVRGERIDGVGSRGTVFLFDETQLAEDVAAAVCRFDGCDRPALGASGGCARHAVGLTRRGRPLTVEHKWRISTRGVPRPYASERLLEDWRTGGPTARALLTPERVSGPARQRWGGRWGARTVPKGGARPRGRPVSEDAVRLTPEVLRRHADGKFSVRSIALHVGLSRRQVEGILRREKVSPKPSD